MRKIILLLSVCALLCGCKEQSAEKKFTRNNDIIQNPGQGWMSIGWKMDPKLPYGSRYVRFHWKSLEPEEGKYNWEPIDKENSARGKARDSVLIPRNVCIGAQRHPICVA